MKRHVAELIEKIEKLCNEGHQTESVSVHIPSTHEREGPSSHTNGQRRTVQLLGVGRYDVINNISNSLPVCGQLTF